MKKRAKTPVVVTERNLHPDDDKLHGQGVFKSDSSMILFGCD